MIPDHLIPHFDPKPNPEAVILEQNVRITVFSSRLLRIEYHPLGNFENRPSQPFWYRNHPKPDFSTRTTMSYLNNETIEILQVSTSDLILEYCLGKPFRPDTLSILVQETGKTWHFGDADTENLGGTCRTLDNQEGITDLELGLLSRSGYAVVDDSNTLVFNESGWLEPRNAPPGSFDLYFFGYGRDYQACIQEYRALTGPVPLIPRWILGNWWSRYWAYSQDQIMALIQDFQNHEVPLSVLIIDMDWHITETGNESSGWTGYTWNNDLFPDPPTLIRHIHERGLRTALNLHPAKGIFPHEEQYPEFAERLAIDPESEQPIPFDIADPQFTNAYFELLHHPQEEIGLDFWWLDWQQGEESKMPGLDPLWWLNHLHYYDMARPTAEGSKLKPKRPFVFSRWGGLGNHRYPIGFSGDTVISWETLQYQPYFTATAANVSYGWWSHDIGGHMSGIEDPELYTRWVQYGVFSPIFRLHSTKNPYHERRPFGYDAETKRLTSYAMRLRHAFIPYLYTMAWRDFHEAISLIRPLYYLEPHKEEAYCEPDTYTFGSELIASPHIHPINPETNLSRQKFWLPEGEWFNFFNGEPVESGHHVCYGELSNIPIFAKAGAIIPMTPLPTWGGVENPTHLKVNIFPGANNQFNLFEDDGQANSYQQGSYALTPFQQNWSPEELEIGIGPATGDLTQCPHTRSYELKIWQLKEPDAVILHINGKPYPVFPQYNHQQKALTIPIELDTAPSDHIQIIVQNENGLHPENNDPVLRACQQILQKLPFEAFGRAGMLERLPEIIQNPNLLARMRPTVTDVQLRALLETITRAGCHFSDHVDDKKLILWNHNPLQETFPVTYHLTVNQLYWGHYPEPYYYESGPLPEFKVFDLKKEFAQHPWELRVIYGDVLTLTFTSDKP